MALIFMVLMFPLILFDRKFNSEGRGIYGAAIWNVGMSVSKPSPYLASTLGGVYLAQSTSATAIVMMVCIITSILSPIMAKNP